MKTPAEGLLLFLLLLAVAVPQAVSQAAGADSLANPPQAGRRLGGLQAERDPVLSPEGDLLVFSREQEYNHDLWVLDLEAPPGTAAQRLTQHAAPDYRPAFSPDGRWIYFVSCRNDAAGDLWRLRLRRGLGGKLKAGRPQAVVERAGTQDNPALDREGRLFWDEESVGGRRVMCLLKDEGVLEILPRAFRPHPGDSGLWVIREDEQQPTVVLLPDSLLLAQAAQREQGLWKPAGQPRSGVLEFGLGQDALFFIAPRTQNRDGSTGLWRLPLDGRSMRPLLTEAREPRQLSAVAGKLAICEGRRQSRLSLWSEWAVVDPAPSAELALARWQEHQADSLSLLLLRSLAADWPGTPQAARARCEELRMRLHRKEDPAALASLASGWRAEAAGTSWADRIQGLEMACQMLATERGDLRAEKGDQLDRFAQYQFERRQPSVAAECWLELGRAWLSRGNSAQALQALLKVETRCGDAPELAEATYLREQAYEMRGEFSAALGTLRLLAERHSDRPDLLEDWVRKDLDRLLVVRGERGVLRVRDRLGALAVIPALRMVYTLELARREAELRSEYHELALEDLSQILSVDLQSLNPFQLRVFTQATLLRARLLAQDGRESLALEELSRAEELMPLPESSSELRRARGELRVIRGQRAWRAGDAELAAAEFQMACRLNAEDVAAWRGRLQALAATGGLHTQIDSLRRLVTSPEATAVSYYALGLGLSWLAEKDLAQLPESRLWLQRAINADQDLAAAYLTLGWDMAREIALMESRKQGLSAFLHELGAHRERLQRLRFDRSGFMAEEGVDQLRNRAISVLKRGMLVASSTQQHELAADLAQNLGNLFFSMGEFGAQRAGQAYTQRLIFSSSFGSPAEELRFRQCRGIALHWEGRLDLASSELNRALELALELGESELQRSLLGRLGLLATERADPLAAQSFYSRALALEGDPGQRSMLHRNLALLFSELGENARAGQELELARRELEEGRKDWPLPDPQNWLKLNLLGLGIPLWNFGDFHTGAGVYHWGPEQEHLLHEALAAELDAAAGEQDARLAGLRLRQRLLKRQGDVEGVVRIELLIAAHLATQRELALARRSFLKAAVGAREAALGISVEGIALGGALNCLLLDPLRDKAWKRELAGARKKLDELFLRDSRGELLPPRSRLLLRVLQLQTLALPGSGVGPVHQLLTRAEALSELDLLLVRTGSTALTAGERVQLHSVLAQLHLDLGEARAAGDRLRQAYRELGMGENAKRMRLLKGELPDASTRPAVRSTVELIPRALLLRLDVYTLRLLLAGQKQDAARAQLELCFKDFRELDPTNASAVDAQLREGLLLELSESAHRLAGSENDSLSRELASYHRWWLAQNALLSQPVRLAGESRQQLWSSWQYDRSSREELRLEWLRRGAPGSGPLCDSLNQELKRSADWLADDLAQTAELDPALLLLMQANAPAGGSAGLPEPGVPWVGNAAYVSQADSNSTLGGAWIGLFGSKASAVDSTLRACPASELLSAGGEEQEARLLALDAELHLHSGAPLASWLEFRSGERLGLASLYSLNFPGDQLLLRGLSWEGDTNTDRLAAWLVLEQFIALSGLRQAHIVAGELEDEEFQQVALHWAQEDSCLVPCYMLGAGALPAETRDQRLRSGIQRLAELGRYYEKQQQEDLAWRSYRRGLDLSLRRGSSSVAGRLLLAAARAAVDGQTPSRALDVLLPLREQIPAGSFDSRTLARHLSYLADLSGQAALADSLWRTEASVTKDEGVAATFGKSSGDSLILRGGLPLEESLARRLLDSRLATLKAHGLHQRVAELARQQELRPADEDPVRALFLGKLYLDDGDALRALQCLRADGVHWPKLNSQASLDRWELISICCQQLELLPAADEAFARADSLLIAGRWTEDRRALHVLRAADLALLKGRPDQAFLHLEQARQLMDANALDLQLLYENTSGLIRHQLQEYDDAKLHFQRALKHALRLRVPAELSAVHNNLSRTLRVTGEAQSALEHCRRALKQDSLAGGAGHFAVSLRNEALAWLALAREQQGALARRGLLKQAGNSLQGAEALSGLRPREEAWITLSRLELMLEEGANAQAEELAQGLHQSAIQGDWFELRWQSARLLGRILQERGKARAAIRLLREEQHWLSERESLLPGMRFGGPIREARSTLATLLADLLAAEGRGLEALFAIEQARSSSLAELMRSRDARDAEGQALVVERDAAAGALTLALLAESSDSDSLRATVDRLQLELDARDTNAAEGRRLLGHENQLQRLLDGLGEDDLLLSWLSLEEHSWCLAARDGKLSVIRMEIGQRELDELVDLHRRRLLDLLNTESSGRKLAEWLLDPVLAQQTRAPQRLIVVTGGRLQHLPFSTLLLADGSLVLENWPLRQLSCLGLLESAERVATEEPGLVFASPAVEGLEELSFAGLEGQSIVELWPTVSMLSSEEASEAALRRDRQPRTFRHFSCHALHDPRSAVASGLLLAAGEGYDGRLDASEIAELELESGLVMLSACETGLGRMGQGDEVNGLPQAFHVAGAASVISTLWKVEDLATAVLVKHLYRGLAQGYPLDEALRLAQLRVRHSINPHPAYWGAFCLSGAADNPVVSPGDPVH